MTETVITVTPQQGTEPKSDSTNPLSWIRINFAYFRTVPGMIKILQVLLGIICMALATPALLAGTHWFLFVVIISFIATLIWIFVYLLSVREALNLPINWYLTELLNTGLITILYAIAFIVQLSVWSVPYSSSHRFSNILAGVIGMINTIVYAIGCYFLYNEWTGSKGSQ